MNFTTDLILIDFRCFKFGDSTKLGVGLIFDSFFAFSSEREYLRGDEVAWYADSDNVVRNEYNPMTAYAFGNRLCTFHILLHSIYR